MLVEFISGANPDARQVNFNLKELTRVGPPDIKNWEESRSGWNATPIQILRAAHDLGANVCFNCHVGFDCNVGFTR